MHYTLQDTSGQGWYNKWTVLISFLQEGVANWSLSQVGDQIFLLISSVPTGFSSTLLLVAADTLLERMCICARVCVRACVRVKYLFQECSSCICSDSAQRSPRTQMLYEISSKKPFLASKNKEVILNTLELCLIYQHQWTKENKCN